MEPCKVRPPLYTEEERTIQEFTSLLTSEEEVQKHQDQVTLPSVYKDREISYTVTLGSRRKALGDQVPETSNDEISGGFSKRRDDFPMVLQHDTPSRFTLMGGPLLNLKGELIGMNIARVNRAENYALPIEVVQESMKRILKNNRKPKPEK